jgi:hypothetical protein
MICREGWKQIWVIAQELDPLLSCCRGSPPSALKILMVRPLVSALAIRVPFGFTAITPISAS